MVTTPICKSSHDPFYSGLLFVSASLFASLAMTGCSSHSPSILPTRLASARPARLTSLNVSSPNEQTEAITHVHSLPLYKEATNHCRQHRYQDASNSLSRLLAEPDLSPSERAFIEQQRLICLRNAGVKVLGKVQTEREKALFAPALTRQIRSTTEEADCGPRALVITAERLGVKTDLARLRTSAGTTEQGTSMEGLTKAVASVGLKSEGLQVSREGLGEIELPAIAYINGNHFVAILERNGKGEDATFRIHDPNQASEQTISGERLLRLSSGYLLRVWK